MLLILLCNNGTLVERINPTNTAAADVSGSLDPSVLNTIKWRLLTKEKKIPPYQEIMFMPIGTTIDPITYSGFHNTF